MRINSGYPIPTPDISDELNHTDEAGEIRRPIEAPEESSVHNESRSRSMQSDLKLAGNLQQTQLANQLNFIGNGSRGPQVTQLQNQLNELRLAQGKPPISADGIFGKETETALKEFQSDTGLRQDGLAGPESKKFLGITLKLCHDPDFQNLSPISKRMAVGSYEAFSRTPETQQQFKDTIKDLGQVERDPGFKALPESTQQDVRTQMFAYSGAPEGRFHLSDLVKDSRFQNLTPDEQGRMMKMIRENQSNELGTRLPHRYERILQTKTLEGPGADSIRTAVFNTMEKLNGDVGKLYLLQEMLDDPKFAESPRDDQLAMMNGLLSKTGLAI